MSLIRRPDVNALFSLVPLNGKAKDVIEDQDNKHLVSLSWKKNLASFDIGFHINSQSSENTLANFGRDDCDITLRPTTIARTHCSFEVDDLNTGTVMFYDRSHSHNTRVSGVNNKPFESGRSPRKILVYPGFNEIISMGGKYGDLIEFELQWIQKEDNIKNIIKKQLNQRNIRITNPRKARTRDATKTALTSAILTPEQAFQTSSQTGLRYFKREFRGGGSFGRVWRVIDVDSGRIMAMKQIDCLPQQQKQEYFRIVRQEVELMRRSKHVRMLFTEPH